VRAPPPPFCETSGGRGDLIDGERHEFEAPAALSGGGAVERPGPGRPYRARAEASPTAP